MRTFRVEWIGFVRIVDEDESIAELDIKPFDLWDVAEYGNVNVPESYRRARSVPRISCQSGV